MNNCAKRKICGKIVGNPYDWQNPCPCNEYVEDIDYPCISFKPLENRDKKSVIEYMNSHPDISNFMVYLRCKYEHQTEWEYLIEACSPDWNDEILWLNDWYEGQQDVEYLAITQIDFWRELDDN